MKKDFVKGKIEQRKDNLKNSLIRLHQKISDDEIRTSQNLSRKTKVAFRF